MRILFAPDYRAGLPYQGYLGEALRAYGVEVAHLSTYSRGLPLYRGALRQRPRPDAVHLHWPEAYFRSIGERVFDRLRMLRYPLDLALVASRFPIFLTAHNLLPHDRGQEPGVARNIRLTARRARKIFVHSANARDLVCRTFGVAANRCAIIPYGDHAGEILPPLPRAAARAQLGLPPADGQKVCLVFGTVNPYKGSDAIVRHWATRQLPHRLVVVGPIGTPAFAAELHRLAAGSPNIDLRLSAKWLDLADLRCWLSAADCTVFNYRDIFTSGAAAQARSFGVPILIPARLKSADLHEPHPHVFRFESLETDFDAHLAAALRTPPDPALALPWREATSWATVARLTDAVYRSELRPAQPPSSSS
jgi:hypothetical protein